MESRWSFSICSVKTGNRPVRCALKVGVAVAPALGQLEVVAQLLVGNGGQFGFKGYLLHQRLGQALGVHCGVLLLAAGGQCCHGHHGKQHRNDTFHKSSPQSFFSAQAPCLRQEGQTFPTTYYSTNRPKGKVPNCNKAVNFPERLLALPRPGLRPVPARSARPRRHGTPAQM